LVNILGLWDKKPVTNPNPSPVRTLHHDEAESQEDLVLLQAILRVRDFLGGWEEGGGCEAEGPGICAEGLELIGQCWDGRRMILYFNKGFYIYL
jgi:hypothetical protein